MAYDAALAEHMGQYLADRYGISEKKMFGGLCFMLNGNMLCGVTKDGGMFRVGKVNEATAVGMDGVDPLSFTGRKMGGMVEVTADLIEDRDRFDQIMQLALEFVGGLPPK